MTNQFDKKDSAIILKSTAGGLSRRDFIKSTAAAGISLAAASQLWSANALAATPKKGGHFRIGIHDANTTDSLDPLLSNSHSTAHYQYISKSLLVELQPDNTIGGALAESWEASADAKTWRFKLRQGVEFHNGKSLTAEDVIASLDAHRTPDSKSPVKSLLEPVEDISADGKYDIVFKVSAPLADLPYFFTRPNFAIMPLNKDGTLDRTSGNGTGAYALQSHEPGVAARFTRNPNYWKSDAAHFDKVTLLGLRDVVSRQTALRNGEVDAISEIDIKLANLLGKDPNVRIDEVASAAAFTMPMNMSNPQWADNDVRLAMKYAINREDLLNKIFRGHATLGNDFPISPGMPYWSELEQREYDPEKAKFHLKKAGKQGFSVDLSTSDGVFSGAVDMATLIAEHAKAAGININVVREPADGYWSDVWLKKPFLMSYWSGRATPDMIYSVAYAADGQWNESGYKGKRFNQLMAQARGELDDLKRAALYREMAQIYRDEGSSIIPIFPNYLFARRSNVMHESQMTSNFPLDGYRAAERWWFA